jgi:hypothetical protein
MDLLSEAGAPVTKCMASQSKFGPAYVLAELSEPKDVVLNSPKVMSVRVLK